MASRPHISMRLVLPILAISITAGALVVSRAEGPPPIDWRTYEPDDAFAKLSRDGKPYPPFYRHYVQPHAVFSDGRIWCAHQDGEGRPIVMSYDLESKTWDGPDRASDFGLGADTHGNPSLCIDRNGRLHIFFGCHGRAMRHIRSTKPLDASAWESLPSPTPKATYPQTMRMSDDRILLFYRAGGHMEPWSMRISEDDGVTWSDAEEIIEMRLEPVDRMAAAYVAFQRGADGETVHAFFVHKDDNPTRVDPHPWRPLKYPGLHEAVYRYNIYYVRRDPVGVWRNAGGRELPLPLSKASADRMAIVHDSGEEFATPKRIVVDSDDRPFLRFTVGVEDWKNGKKIIPQATHYAAPNSDGTWAVSRRLPTEWPDRVKTLVDTPGAPVYGLSSPIPWFVFQGKNSLKDKKATYVFLGNVNEGYATRREGAASPPTE